MAVGIGWNSAAVRARLLAGRRLGGDARRALARSRSLRDALTTLRDGPYGHDVTPDLSLADARWAVEATPLWHLRILAGWLPPAGGELIRALVGWWEVRNIENALAGLTGGATFAPYELGSLASAWRQVRSARSVEEVRAALARSVWLDPGGDAPADIVRWLRLSWARRVAEDGPDALRMVAGWAALVAARDLVLGGRAIGPVLGRAHVLGRDVTGADDPQQLAARLPRDAGWVLRDIDDPTELWRAEQRWWRRLDDESGTLLRHPRAGPAAVVGAFGVLLADAHAVQAALAVAARGRPAAEAIDELC
jgi:hypothetical protein